MIRLGGPVFTQERDPEALARAHRAAGYDAAYCPKLDPRDGAAVRATREAFARHDVAIAEVGVWCNLIGTDAAQRRANIAMVAEGLALADEIGARCCVDYAGTRAPGGSYGPHPDNFGEEAFALTVEAARAVIDAVKPRNARFSLEMMQTCPPDSVDGYLALIRAVDRPAFAVHLDPVNILYAPRDCYANGRIIEDCVRRLGPWIVSCHAKDLVVREGLALHIDEVRPGLGVLDYRAYIGALRGLGRDMTLMLEHLASEAEYRAARDHVAGVIAS